ncbi:hypothetical protein [Devosia sp. CN2-171]|jgi:hypothetical protein|uniref:hypothetical protein n=1 Tax=Devosia sp. CN2-171 TaxID=3400909 RepID=UPI003BF8A01B
MTKTIVTIAATACGICVLAAVPASAADVRSELSPDLIYDHCLAAGVGSETEGIFMLPGGRRVTGTVLCTAEDLVVAKAKPSRQHDDDEDDDDEDEEQENDGYEA